MFCVISVERGSLCGSVMAERLGQDLESLSPVINQQQHFRGLVHLRDVTETKLGPRMALLAYRAIAFCCRRDYL